MDLSNLTSLKSHRRSKRTGRGFGSGKGGHTTGRGNKGQKSRGRLRPTFEGGQLPLYKRIPKRAGFRSRPSAVLSLGLSKFSRFSEGEKITVNLLRKSLKVKKGRGAIIKIIDDGGSVKAKLNFEGVVFSKGAAKKITASGGKIS